MAADIAGASRPFIMRTLTPKVIPFQILTPFTRREDLDPLCQVLDNSANERADWYEYWPIRQYLLSNQLEEGSFYGFLSPRFKEKTNLRVQAAVDFIHTQPPETDIVLFSPSLHLTAYHWNIFKYGDACHPGLEAAAAEFFARIGRGTDLNALVTHSLNEVYSNYFFATPRFWRLWLQVTEQLIAIAESPDDVLGKKLRALTSYRGRFDTQLKIFLMERIPTWILATDSDFKARVRDPFAVRSRLYKVPCAILCDAIKIAYEFGGSQPWHKDLFSVLSRVGRPMSNLIRIAGWLGIMPVKNLLTRLSLNWNRAGRL